MGGLSLQTQHSRLYPLLSLPFRIFIQSIYLNVVYHLISSSASSHLPYLLELPSAGSSFLASVPAYFFFFLISSSIILPSPTLSRTTEFFILSILHAPSFSIPTSQMLPVVLPHSVVVSRSLHHTTLLSTQDTLLVCSVVLFPRARRKCLFCCYSRGFFCHRYPLLYYLTAVHVAIDISSGGSWLL